MRRPPPRSTRFPYTTLVRSERDIAMVFQFYALYPSLTVKQNLAFPLQAERLPEAEIEERVMRVARTLDLAGVLDRRSEEHTSELQSRQYLVCRLLLEKTKTT